jgi:hypothetical protein
MSRDTVKETQPNSTAQRPNPARIKMAKRIYVKVPILNFGMNVVYDTRYLSL